MAVEKRVVEVDLIADVSKFRKELKSANTAFTSGLFEVDKAFKKIFNKDDTIREFASSLDFSTLTKSVGDARLQVEKLKASVSKADNRKGFALEESLNRMSPTIQNLVKGFGIAKNSANSFNANAQKGFASNIKAAGKLFSAIENLYLTRKSDSKPLNDIKIAATTIRSTMNSISGATEQNVVKARKLVAAFEAVHGPVEDYHQAISQTARALERSNRDSKGAADTTKKAIFQALEARKADVKATKAQVAASLRLADIEKRRAATVGVTSAVKTISASGKVTDPEQLALSKALQKANKEGLLTKNQLVALGNKSLKTIRAETKLKNDQVDIEKRITKERRERLAIEKAAAKAKKNLDSFQGRTKQIAEERKLTNQLIAHTKANNKLASSDREVKTAIKATLSEMKRLGIAFKGNEKLAQARLRQNLRLANSYNILENATDKAKNSQLGSLGALALVDRSLHRVINTLRIVSRRFSEFESQLVEVRKTASASQADMIALGQEIISLGQATAVPVNDLAAIAGVLGQIGQITGGGLGDAARFADQARESIALVAQVSQSTDLSAEDAAKSFGILSSIFTADVQGITDALAGIKGGTANATDALRVMFGVMNELSNSSIATVRDLNRFIENFGGVAAQVGLTQAETAALGATIRDLGITSKVAGTALSRIFADMTKKSQVFADAIGTTKESFEALFLSDPNRAVLDFLEALGSSSKKRQLDIKNQLALEQRASNTLLKLANNTALYEKHIKTANNSLAAFNSIQAEADKFNQTYAASLIRVSNAFTGLINSFRPAFEIIAGLADVLSSAILTVSQFLDQFQGLTEIISILGLITIGVGSLAAAFIILKSTLSFLDVGTGLAKLDAALSKSSIKTLFASKATAELGVVSGRTAVAVNSLSVAEKSVAGSTTAATIAMELNTKAQVKSQIASKSSLRSLGSLTGKMLTFGTAIGAAAFALNGDFASALTILLVNPNSLIFLISKLGLLGSTLFGVGGKLAFVAKAFSGLAAGTLAVGGTLAAAGGALIGVTAGLIVHGDSIEALANRTSSGTSKMTDTIIKATLHTNSWGVAIARTFGFLRDTPSKLEEYNTALQLMNTTLKAQPALLNLQSVALERHGKAAGLTTAEVKDLSKALEAGTVSYDNIEKAISRLARTNNRSGVDKILGKTAEAASKFGKDLAGSIQLTQDGDSVGSSDSDIKNLKKYLEILKPRWEKALSDYYINVKKFSAQQAAKEISGLSSQGLLDRVLGVGEKALGITVDVVSGDAGITLERTIVKSFVAAQTLLEPLKDITKLFEQSRNFAEIIENSLAKTATLTKGNASIFDFSAVDDLEKRLSLLAQAKDLIDEKQADDINARVAELGKAIEQLRKARATLKDGENSNELYSAEDLATAAAAILKMRLGVERLLITTQQKANADKLKVDIETQKTLFEKQKQLFDDYLSYQQTEIASAAIRVSNIKVDVDAGRADVATLIEAQLQEDLLKGVVKIKSDIHRVDQQLLKGQKSLTDAHRESLESYRDTLIASKESVVLGLREAAVRDKIANAVSIQTSRLAEAAANAEKLHTSTQERLDLEQKSQQDIIDRSAKLLTLERERLALNSKLITVQRSLSDTGTGGIAAFSTAMDAAAKSTSTLIAEILKVHSSDADLQDRLVGLSTAYRSIEQSAKRAAFESGKFADGRRALEESFRKDPSSEKARAAEQLFKRVRDIKNSGASQETIFANIGATISLFERRAKNLKGVGTSVSQIVKVAEQLAFSEQNRLSTSDELAKKLGTEFATRRKGYGDQIERLKRIDELQREIADNQDRPTRRRSVEKLKEELTIELDKLQDTAKGDAGSKVELEQIAVRTAAESQLAAVVARTATSMAIFDKTIKNISLSVDNLQSFNTTKISGSGLSEFVSRIQNGANLQLAANQEALATAVAASKGAAQDFTAILTQALEDSLVGVAEASAGIKNIRDSIVLAGR